MLLEVTHLNVRFLSSCLWRNTQVSLRNVNRIVHSFVAVVEMNGYRKSKQKINVHTVGCYVKKLYHCAPQGLLSDHRINLSVNCSETLLPATGGNNPLGGKRSGPVHTGFGITKFISRPTFLGWRDGDRAVDDFSAIAARESLWPFVALHAGNYTWALRMFWLCCPVGKACAQGRQYVIFTLFNTEF